MPTFFINEKEVTLDLGDGKNTLKTIQKNLSLSGTKESCGEGDCGACMVLVGETSGKSIFYKAVNSCLLPIGSIHGKHVVSIEGLNFPKELGIIQECFATEFASQCGFCTPGFIISLTAYLLNVKKWDKKELQQSISGNLCRCTGYSSIKRAVKSLEEKNFIPHLEEQEPGTPERIMFLIEQKILPEYFAFIPKRLQEIIPKRKGENTGKIVSGGTDLLVRESQEIEEAEIRFISDEKDMGEIREKEGRITLGGGVTFEQFRNSAVIQNFFPQAKESFTLTASLPIRNKATIAGNIINASPIGDMTIFLLVLDPTVTFTSEKGFRTVPLRKLYLGYKKPDIKSTEVLTTVDFEKPKEKTLLHFEKISKRTHLDIASVNTAISITEEDGVIQRISLSAGGVAPIPLFLEKTSEYLLGKKIDAETLLEALKITDMEISPISDVRGSELYKRLLLKRLIFAHFITLFPERIKTLPFSYETY